MSLEPGVLNKRGPGRLALNVEGSPQSERRSRAGGFVDLTEAPLGGVPAYLTGVIKKYAENGSSGAGG